MRYPSDAVKVGDMVQVTEVDHPYKNIIFQVKGTHGDTLEIVLERSGRTILDTIIYRQYVEKVDGEDAQIVYHLPENYDTSPDLDKLVCKSDPHAVGVRFAKNPQECTCDRCLIENFMRIPIPEDELEEE